MKTRNIVQIENVYNREGYLVKRSYNGCPVFVPKQDHPMVQIVNFDTEYVTEIKYMTRKEFDLRFKDLVLYNINNLGKSK